MRSKTKTSPTTRDIYREAFKKADRLLHQIGVLMSEHSSRHEEEGMPVEQVLAMQDVARLLEGAAARLKKDLP